MTFTHSILRLGLNETHLMHRAQLPLKSIDIEKTDTDAPIENRRRSKTQLATRNSLHTIHLRSPSQSNDHPGHPGRIHSSLAPLLDSEDPTFGSSMNHPLVSRPRLNNTTYQFGIVTLMASIKRRKTSLLAFRCSTFRLLKNTTGQNSLAGQGVHEKLKIIIMGASCCILPRTGRA
ncbi:cohesin-associated protein pds5 [Moniliophthora roreri]|nr:cohesin-associated protein pds5 [Moniliophthora roreri]